MSNRFFLSTFLPFFSLSEAHPLSLEELEFALEQNLSQKEQKIISQVWWLGDIENIRSYLSDQPMRKKGSLEPEEIIEMMSGDEKKPAWLKNFFLEFPKDEDRAAKSFLLSRYFLTYTPSKSLHKSIRELLLHDFETRAVFEYVRGGLKKDNIPECLTEDQTERSIDYQKLVSLWNTYKNDPLQLEKRLAEWRYQVLEEKRERASPFSLSRLIFSIALFECIEGRRSLVEQEQNKAQERIVKALNNDNT